MTSGVAPARRVDVRVIRVHPLIIDVTPAIIVDLEEKPRHDHLCVLIVNRRRLEVVRRP